MRGWIPPSSASPCLPVSEYPRRPAWDGAHAITLEQRVLKRMLRLTCFCKPRDVLTQPLDRNGVRFYLEGDSLMLGAIGGKRMAVCRYRPERLAHGFRPFLAPFSVAPEIERLLGDVGQVAVFAGANRVFVNCGTVRLVAAIPEDESPDYGLLIPSPSDRLLRVDRRRLLEVVQRFGAAQIAQVESLEVKLTPDTLALAGLAGQPRAALPAAYSGRDLTLGLTLGDLRDILELVEEDTITFEVPGAAKPMVYRSPDLIYLMMPTWLDSLRAQAGLGPPPLFANSGWIQEISKEPDYDEALRGRALHE